MDEQKLLKTIGISSGIIIAGGLIWLGINAYKAYFEIKLTKLQVEQLEKELGR